MSNIIGTLPGWATLVTLLGVAWIMFRGGVPGAITGLREANEVLTSQLVTAKAEIETLKTKVHELENKTDITAAIAPLLDAHARHETAATKRSDAILAVLDMMAQRLGHEGD